MYAIIQNPVLHQQPPKTSVLTGLKNSAHVSWPSLAWVQTCLFLPIQIKKLPFGGLPQIVPNIHCKITSHKIHLHWLPFNFKTRGRETAVPVTWIYFINEFICCNIYLKDKKIEETRQKNEKIEDSRRPESQSSLLSIGKNPKHFFLTIILVPVLPLAGRPRQKLHVSTLFNPALSKREFLSFVTLYNSCFFLSYPKGERRRQREHGNSTV